MKQENDKADPVIVFFFIGFAVICIGIAGYWAFRYLVLRDVRNAGHGMSQVVDHLTSGLEDAAVMATNLPTTVKTNAEGKVQ